jgi:hypothetical protein
MGTMAGRCVRENPELAIELMSTSYELDRKTQPIRELSRRVAVAAYERSFPGQGTSKLAEAEKAAAHRVVNDMLFSLDNCRIITRSEK